MKKLNQIPRIPKAHQIIWWVCRAALLGFSVWGIFHNSVTMFLMGLFSIGFSHLWDLFTLLGGKSFITRVNYFSQTLLAVFLVYSCIMYYYNARYTVPFMDDVSHAASGFIAAWFGFDFITVMQGRYRHIKPAVAAMFSITFGAFLATAWEFYEFIMDRVYGYTLQTSNIISERGLVDTMIDMMFGVGGALIGMFICSFYRTGIIGVNRKEVRKKVVAQSKSDREEELKLLGIDEDG